MRYVLYYQEFLFFEEHKEVSGRAQRRKREAAKSIRKIKQEA